MPDTVISVGGDITDLQRKFGQAGKEVTNLGQRVAATGKKNAGINLLGDLGSTLRGVVGLTAVKGFMDQFDRVGDLARRLDTSAESLQRLGNMAKLSGTDVETAARSMTMLQKNLGQAAPGDGLRQAIQRLGIDARTFTALDPDKAFLVLASAFQEAERKGTGFADVFEIMGRQAGELIPALRTSRAELEAIGSIPVVSDDTIARIQQMNDLFDEAIIRSKAGVATFGTVLGESLAIWAEALSSTEWDDMLNAGKKADEISRGIDAERKAERAREEAERQKRRQDRADELSKQQQITQEKKQSADLAKSQARTAEKRDELAVLQAKASGNKRAIEKAERTAKINEETRRGIAEGLSPQDARKEAMQRIELQERIDFRAKNGGRGKITGVRQSDIKARPSSLDEFYSRQFGVKNGEPAKKFLGDEFQFPALDRFGKQNQRDAAGKLLTPVGKGFGRDVQAQKDQAKTEQRKLQLERDDEVISNLAAIRAALES